MTNQKGTARWIFRIICALLAAAGLLLGGRYAYASEDGMQSGFSKIIDSIKETKEELADAAGDVYNVLLIGVDRRDTSWNGNSDTMILLSVNRVNKKVTVMSFMRDLYAVIEGHGVKKLNAACAIGGPSLLISTLKSNYGVDVNNYACVDFNSMIDIIDALGGIELDISDAEADSANGSIREMAALRGEDPESHYFSGGGTYTCDGLRTVAYARIRKVGNNDYERTQRQRDIVAKIAKKITSLDKDQLAVFITTAFSIVSHDFSSADMLSLAAWAPEILTYERNESRVPYDGMYYTQSEILTPDQPATNDKIHEELYGA